MRLPILAFCNGWLNVYRSVKDAAIDMEPTDVDNGEWEAFDASGQVLKLTVHKRRTRGLWSLFSRFEEIVLIAESTPQEDARERLRTLILQHIEKMTRDEQHTANIEPELAEQLLFEELIDRMVDSQL